MHCLDSIGNIKQSTIQQVIAGPVMQDIRTHMSQGKWHSACNLCKQSEESSGASARTVRMISADTMASIDQNINHYELQHVVVNWSNLCNLSCTYCNPETSTAWQSIKKIPINHVKNKHADLIELARQHGHQVQGLTLGGGEPLLQKGLVEFLKCLVPQQVHVMVTTNLSMNLTTNAVYQELKNWPAVDWQISFDNANKEKFEYVRNQASWEQFEANIKILKQDGQHVVAHPAYSIYCALDLVEYYEYCEANQLSIFWCDLTHPWDLDIRRLTTPIRNLAIEEIDRVINKWGSNGIIDTSTLQRYRANLIDPTFLTNFRSYRANPFKYSRAVEKELGKTNTFEELWPKLTDLIEKYHYETK
jgi:organic radical activating enzyme